MGRELFRRLALVGGAWAAVWAALYVPHGLLMVAPVDFTAQYHEDPRRWAGESPPRPDQPAPPPATQAVQAYIDEFTQGRLVRVGEDDARWRQWAEFHDHLFAAVRGQRGGEDWRHRVTVSGHIFFDPRTPPLDALAGQLRQGHAYLYVAIGGEPPRYLNVSMQMPQSAAQWGAPPGMIIRTGTRVCGCWPPAWCCTCCCPGRRGSARFGRAAVVAMDLVGGALSTLLFVLPLWLGLAYVDGTTWQVMADKWPLFALLWPPSARR